MDKTGEVVQGLPIYRDDGYGQTRLVVKADCDREECDNKVVRRKDKYLENEVNYCSHPCAMEDRDQRGSKNGNYQGKREYFEKVRASSECVVCGEEKSELLEFHHKEPEEKLEAVSRMSITAEYSLEDLKKEIEKCITICSNCHAVKHKRKSVAEEEKEVEVHKIDLDSAVETEQEFRGKPIYLRRLKDGNEHRHIIRSCDFCGQRYFARVDLIKNGKGRYHNLSCSTYGKWQNGVYGESKEQKKREIVQRIKEDSECEKRGCKESRKECLEFHHNEPREKVATISDVVEEGYTIEQLRKEIEKCLIYCRNCHMLHHTSA